MENQVLSFEERTRLARRNVEILHAWPTETGSRMIVLKVPTRFLLEQVGESVVIYRWRTAVMLESRPVVQRATIAAALHALADADTTSPDTPRRTIGAPSVWLELLEMA